jgi:FkbM family methyltransferase
MGETLDIAEAERKLGNAVHSLTRVINMLGRLKKAILNPKNAIRNRIIRHCDLGDDIAPALHRLRANTFSPSHIFDVGAHTGEFAKMCREVWPDAKLTCFEVLPHCVEQLRQWSKADGNAEVFECLLGPEVRSDVKFHENETASSVLDDYVVHSDPAPVRLRPMRTVDDVVANSSMTAPAFLKLDVQGYEYEVLQGAKKTLPRIEAILAEVNLLDLYKDAHLLADLVALLKENGFVAYDICGFWRRPLDAALWNADFIFVPIGSPLRADKRWST